MKQEVLAMVLFKSFSLTSPTPKLDIRSKVHTAAVLISFEHLFNQSEGKEFFIGHENMVAKNVRALKEERG
jgi:hypothetical protein